MRIDKQIAASRLDGANSRLQVELQPQTAIEHMLVKTIAAAQWRKLRIRALENATIDAASREHKRAITWGSCVRHPHQRFR